MDCLHPENRGLAIDCGVELPDQTILVEYEKGVVAPAALGRASSGTRASGSRCGCSSIRSTATARHTCPGSPSRSEGQSSRGDRGCRGGSGRCREATCAACRSSATGPRRRDTAPDRSSVAPARGARTACGPAPVPAEGARAGRPSRGGSRRRGRRWGDGRSGVELQQGQRSHDREQLGRPGCVEHLRAHGDMPGLLLREPVHRVRLGETSRGAVGSPRDGPAVGRRVRGRLARP